MHKCYTRWNIDYLICLCKVANPVCDRFKTCEINDFEYIKYKGIKDFMQHDKYKKVHGVVKHY